MNKLTEQQENLIKDILKLIGQDEELNANVAEALGLPLDEFNNLTDAAFTALGNGRVTVVE